ncbi:hypothetical protein E4U42_007784 [Claviceps africana]|uniref:TPX2 C-terminal domain-containing protein n=1 Tax=Claviceps africana TaxID=83212 RepID=A0A8K0J0R4_9HYPO|nr:hypothetical protein E4U42_007784 [Claviceps africana]
MAHKSPKPARRGFAIFDDCGPASKDEHTATTRTASSVPDVLRELSRGKSQSRAVPIIDAAASSPAKSPRRESLRIEAKSTKCQAVVRFTPRAQRPQAHAEVFEPLVAVPEEAASLAETRDAVASPSPAEAGEENPAAAAAAATPSPSHLERQMLLPTATSNLCLEEQVEKHLAGQFEWIMTYPAGAGSRAVGDGITKRDGQASSTATVYGCNMLPARRRQSASQTPSELSTDVFTLLATALTGDSCHYPSMTERKDAVSSNPGQLCQVPPPPYPGTPVKASEVTTEAEPAASSPSLSVVRERTDSIASRWSGAGSFSVPRTEDSFEALDEAKNELEADGEVTCTSQHVDAREKTVQAGAGDASTKALTCKTNKRASVAGFSATVRVKSRQEKPPSLRRCASFTLQDKKTSQQGSSAQGLRKEASPFQSQRASNRLGTPRAPIKSSKPPTVPNFELPGEAVARRLKEQREARLAQQAEAQKAQAPPAPKPRLNKLLALPTFELPGEAISRRKREEREAKLRAEEEEARRRREFKARPVRQSIGPAAPPRETLTSRARQSKPLAQAAGEGEMGQKRLSVGLVGHHARVLLPNNKSPQTRGRSSRPATSKECRAASASTGRGGGQPSSVSLEALPVQRQRGRELVKQDGSPAQGRKKEKQERETTTQTARDGAAERSGMASREWAEKMRRKGLAGGQAKENQDDKSGLGPRHGQA